MMRRASGQALVIAVLILAIGAIAVAGLRTAQDLLIVRVRDDRAGEAAVQAAGAVVADRLVRGRDATGLTADPAVARDARVAALAVASANGGGAPGEVAIAVGARSVWVELSLAGRPHRVEVPWPCCPR